ncbi:MAG: tRNA pseudouridine(55) synthase TruB [Bacilli bacterium]|jgi:tRNA pseudouridine55 synthase|nr:tRNA pseudouridine(55) synthase TruB [Bacilli bacterium]
METSGIILIDKDPGLTTVQEEVVVKRRLGVDRAGHAGTLDPFASGLLLIGINRGTKVLTFFEDKTKSYEADLLLGEKTGTGDIDGTVIEKKEPSLHTEEEINKVLASFVGDTFQIPPMYSAIKKDGVPLYKMAREGLSIERAPRKVHIASLKLLSYDPAANLIRFSTDVSKGTYIRTLGEDIAKGLNEIGHLTALRRTRVGGYSIDKAVKPLEALESDIIPIKELFKGITFISASPDQIKRIGNGADVALDSSYPDMVMFLNPQGEAMAIYQKADKGWYKVFKEFL